MKAEEDATKITYSFAEWQNEIKRLRPFQLNEYFERCFESEKPYVGQINFLSAVMDRFLEFGYIHHPDLSNEGRKVFIEMGHTVADMIRNVYKDKPDVLRRFEEAYNHSVSLYKKFEGVR